MRCRFCKETIATGENVHYAVRHHAHYRCYITGGKALYDLQDWQIVLFPYNLIKEFGLTDIAERASAREEERLNKLVTRSRP